MSVCVSVLLLLLLLPSLLVVVDAVSTTNSKFIPGEMCDVEESINRECSKEIDGARSNIECAILCWRDTECLGASLDVLGRCLHHFTCHTSVPCPTGPDAVKHRYMARYCVHGTLDSSTQSCVCRYETFGERCNQYHSNCTALVGLGYSKGSYLTLLDPLQDEKNLIKVYCTIVNPAINSVVIRIYWKSRDMDFNRTWNEYVNGFIEDSQNMWIGLRAVQILTQAEVRTLYVVLRFTGGNIYAIYNNFKIGNASTGYAFWGDYSTSVDNGSPPAGFYAGDCLSAFIGVPFSTWDRDQDGSVGGENCASMAGSGWWYKDGNCDLPCNLLGWGLDNYNATPPRQRFTFLGTDLSQNPSEVSSIDLYFI